MASAFWAESCSPRTKRRLLALLVACFVGQSLLVYSDSEARAALSPQAAAGRRIWHERNCNACHQLYGLGGFLGPDLTNAAARLTPARLQEILTNGSGPMPAFGLPARDISALTAFLRAMNTSGRGQARLVAEGPTALQRIDLRVSGVPRAGFEVFRARCVACHIPFGQSPVGAPDPSRIDLPPARLAQALVAGKPPRMPPPNLNAEERRAVTAFFAWLRHERATLVADSPGELPWWEYR